MAGRARRITSLYELDIPTRLRGYRVVHVHVHAERQHLGPGHHADMGLTPCARAVVANLAALPMSSAAAHARVDSLHLYDRPALRHERHHFATQCCLESVRHGEADVVTLSESRCADASRFVCFLKFGGFNPPPHADDRTLLEKIGASGSRLAEEGLVVLCSDWQLRLLCASEWAQLVATSATQRICAYSQGWKLLVLVARLPRRLRRCSSRSSTESLAYCDPSRVRVPQLQHAQRTVPLAFVLTTTECAAAVHATFSVLQREAAQLGLAVAVRSVITDDTSVYVNGLRLWLADCGAALPLLPDPPLDDEDQLEVEEALRGTAIVQAPRQPGGPAMSEPVQPQPAAAPSAHDAALEFGVPGSISAISGGRLAQSLPGHVFRCSKHALRAMQRYGGGAGLRGAEWAAVRCSLQRLIYSLHARDFAFKLISLGVLLQVVLPRCGDVLRPDSSAPAVAVSDGGEASHGSAQGRGRGDGARARRSAQAQACVGEGACTAAALVVDAVIAAATAHLTTPSLQRACRTTVCTCRAGMESHQLHWSHLYRLWA